MPATTLDTSYYNSLPLGLASMFTGNPAVARVNPDPHGWKAAPSATETYDFPHAIISPPQPPTSRPLAGTDEFLSPFGVGFDFI
jgi:hypothetical protein